MSPVAGVDSSTQSTKVEIRDAGDGRLLGSGQAPHPEVHPPPVAEQQPSSWWTAFESALKLALDAAGGLAVDAIEAIAVAGQQHGCVALDAGGEVIRPAQLWCDTTAAPDADWLVDQLSGGAPAWAQACGSAPRASFTIAKLSWLHRSEPENWTRMARVCLPHDWVTFRLGGELVTDRGDASGTGYWSPADERYRTDLLEIVDSDREWEGALPRVLGPIEPAGQWGRAVVGPGTGDNMAAALGLGAEPGDVLISVGTSGVVSVVAEQPVADPHGTVAGFADATGRYLPLVCTLNAAGVTDVTARLLGVDLATFDQMALAGPTGGNGLTFLPYLAGERTPNRPDATGALVGLRTDASREALARATVEGVVCGLLDGLDALADHARTDDGRLHLVGGGARSVAYRQVLADLAQRPVVTSDATEPVATGAAVQAAAVLGRRDPVEVRRSWAIGNETVTDPTIEPDLAADVRVRYRATRDRQAPAPD